MGNYIFAIPIPASDGLGTCKCGRQSLIKTQKQLAPLKVRPCTMEAVQFVEAVMAKERPRGELRELLKRACSRHQRLYQVSR